MRKPTMAYLAIGFSLVSLIISILTYYGLIRYTKLYHASTEQFTSTYSQLPTADDTCKVVVAFSTTPDRLEKIEPMLNSLLDQTVKVDEIALNIPFHTHKGKTYHIPPAYKKFLKVYSAGKDYGSCTGLLPCLRREGEKGTKIIFVADNQIYGKDLIETLVDESNKHPDKVISTKQTSVLDPTGGILVKPEFFESAVLDSTNSVFDLPWINKHLNCPIQYTSYMETFSF